MDVTEICKQMNARIDSFKMGKNTHDHNRYVRIHNQYFTTVSLIESLSQSSTFPPKDVPQLVAECGVTHFIRVFSHIEFNVKQLARVISDPHLPKFKKSIREHKKLSLRNILREINSIPNMDIGIEEWYKLMHVRNILVHNDGIADVAKTYDFDDYPPNDQYSTKYGKIVLKPGQSMEIPADFLIRITDLLICLYDKLVLFLVHDDIIDIDVINRTIW